MNRYIAFFLSAALFLLSGYAYAQPEAGFFNLEEHDFSKSNYTLKGEWEFYPKQLLSPDSFNTSSKNYSPEKISVPGLWDESIMPGFVSGQGYGTYRLLFKVNVDLPVLSINLNKVQNAYSLWINDSLFAEVGKVGNDRESSEPRWNSRNYTFVNKGENELILQVSNFYHKKGGIEHSPYIGIPNRVERNSWQTLGFDHFIMGLLLIMGVYHFGLFLLKRNEWSVLFFGLLTLSSVLFTLTVGEIALSYFIPDFNWEILVKTNYISNYARVLFFGLFIGFLFPSPFRKKLMFWVAGFALIMILFISIFPARVYTHSLVVMLIYSVLMVGYFVSVTIQAVLQKQRGAIFSLAGTGILFVAVINDVVKELFLLNTPSTATYGLFFFVLLQSDMLAFRSAASFRELSKLTNRLLILTRIKDELLMHNSAEPNRPLQIISQNINADHAVAIIHQNAGWQIVGEYYRGKMLQRDADQSFIDPDSPDDNELDYDLIKSAISSKRTRYRYAGSNRQQRRKAGNAFTKVCMPVNKGTDIISLFYAQNFNSELPFDEEKKLLLELIKPQLSVITQNALAFNELEQFNRQLEETVQERTEEIIQQSEELRAQKEEIGEKNNVLNAATQKLSLQNSHISDSINYARRIQQALFPTMEEMRDAFPESYVFFQPKDVLSGDFYWTGFSENNGKEYSLLAVADATGHGVPGALMAVIGDNLLNAAVYQKSLVNPSDILAYLDTELFKRLDKEQSEQFEADGINIGLLAYHKETGTAMYSGAYHPLYISISGEISTFPALNRQTGIRHSGSSGNVKYFDHELELKEGTLFLCSDGFAKQISDKDNKKINRKRFRTLLSDVSQMPFEKQAMKLQEVFDEMKGTNEQTDDVLIAAVKI